MTKQMKADIIWDAFCEITERSMCTCIAIMDSETKISAEDSDLDVIYGDIFKPDEPTRQALWLTDQFQTLEEKHIWRMNALLLFREMILTGDV